MTNTKIDVSIIVAVHNAGIHLRKCLQSLKEQTLINKEIILVLDCPTDGSELICHEFAKVDPDFKILENTENLHIGNSRNKGMMAAKGKYIAFVDHDDRMIPEMYQRLFNQAEESRLEIVWGVPVYELGNKTEINPEFDIHKEYSQNDLLRNMIRGGDDVSCTPVLANVHPNLYLRSFLESYKIQFADTRHMTPEDRLFNLQCLINTTKTAFCKDIQYYHLLRMDSTGKNSAYISCKSRLNGKIQAHEFLMKSGLLDEFRTDFYASVKKELSNCLINSLVKDWNMTQFIRMIQEMKSHEFILNAFSKGKYSTNHYRLGGKVSRCMIDFLFKI